MKENGAHAHICCFLYAITLFPHHTHTHISLSLRPQGPPPPTHSTKKNKKKDPIDRLLLQAKKGRKKKKQRHEKKKKGSYLKKKKRKKTHTHTRTTASGVAYMHPSAAGGPLWEGGYAPHLSLTHTKNKTEAPKNEGK
eukprot:TRINITY_DN5379_c1_g1_i2.p1 TRINITY_DN5379_c1_g1~~TRINITY_DN5379_c1_g1_i2.p1  ORF type:complete len:138 (+),score=2.27 TRINITY_DN5379_c1_g1_i2:213-626(+)